MEEKKLRDMISLETKSNHDINDLLEEIQNDPKYLNIKLSELKWGGNKPFGNYEVFEYRGKVFVIDKTKETIIVDLQVYNHHDFTIIPEKELLVVYGHEEILLYFLDGTLKSIRTR